MSGFLAGVRGQLNVLVAATTSLVLIAFLVPMGLLLRRAADDRAVTTATIEAQSAAALVALGQIPPDHDVTVFYADGHQTGIPAQRTDSVSLALQGWAFTAKSGDGVEVLIPVGGLPEGTAVVRANVTQQQDGVIQTWVTLALLGLVLFALYVAGIVGAFIVALVLRRTVTKGSAGGFIMELPKYQWPPLRDILLGLWQRAWIFLRRAGTIIFTVSVVLWLLLSFPRAAPGENQVDASFAGHIANGLQVVLEPIGFNREISLALIPAMAAREVAVASLATTYAVDAGNKDDDAEAQGLIPKLQAAWSLPTALAFLAWFVFAPQCLSTIAVARRETNGWKWPLFMLAYLFALAYIFAGITYWSAVALGL